MNTTDLLVSLGQIKLAQTTIQHQGTVDLCRIWRTEPKQIISGVFA